MKRILSLVFMMCLFNTQAISDDASSSTKIMSEKDGLSIHLSKFSAMKIRPLHEKNLQYHKFVKLMEKGFLKNCSRSFNEEGCNEGLLEYYEGYLPAYLIHQQKIYTLSKEVKENKIVCENSSYFYNQKKYPNYLLNQIFIYCNSPRINKTVKYDREMVASSIDMLIRFGHYKYNILEDAYVHLLEEFCSEGIKSEATICKQKPVLMENAKRIWQFYTSIYPDIENNLIINLAFHLRNTGKCNREGIIHQSPTIFTKYMTFDFPYLHDMTIQALKEQYEQVYESILNYCD